MDYKKSSLGNLVVENLDTLTKRSFEALKVRKTQEIQSIKSYPPIHVSLDK